MSTQNCPEQNRLLAAMPGDVLDRIAPYLEYVPLPLGKALYEPGLVMKYVYFPTSAVVSLLYVLENGASAEFALVGNEGILGISQFMGGDSTTSQAMVTSAGYGYRLASNLLKLEFNGMRPTLPRRLNRRAQVEGRREVAEANRCCC